MRRAMMRIPGIVSRATTVSSGDRISMMTSEMRNMRMFPLMIGRKASNPWMRLTSEFARETSWPVWSSSWRAKSSRWSWS
jgi:hypothetical protein